MPQESFPWRTETSIFFRGCDVTNSRKSFLPGAVGKTDASNKKKFLHFARETAEIAAAICNSRVSSVARLQKNAFVVVVFVVGSKIRAQNSAGGPKSAILKNGKINAVRQIDHHKKVKTKILISFSRSRGNCCTYEHFFTFKDLRLLLIVPC